jgi:hypothetical protein
LKVSSFRRNRGDSNRVGNFDAEIVPGIVIKNMTLMQNQEGRYTVFAKGVYLQNPAADDLAALAIAALAAGGRHDGR